MPLRAAFHNLGCKVNAYEVEAMQQMMTEAGYELVPFTETADVYVINTCTVTNIADRKSRQMLHRAKKQNPSAVVVAVGCYAQVRGEELEKDPAIDLVIGTNRKAELVPLLEAYRKQEKEHSEKNRPEHRCEADLTQDTAYEELQISGTKEHTRAFIKVQDGCDRFCSYCIIPYARGRVRSRRPEDVCREAERLTAAGIKEIVLTGIHICSYGKDLEGDTELIDLIRAVHEIDGVERLRLGSLEPSYITEKTAKAMADLPGLCAHFHLSLQSGCDATLQRMNRRYTTEEYAAKAALLRQYFDDPTLTTDIITGFPGETEEEFTQTVRFVEKLQFFETHVFPYSR
ncbi:MAG: tRNA (N(6)-L-threonylcarbamoyladenosine(37)-C(2))-methylthiotransferase MtaB, partial [Eubacterium sp.]|nr:tRNA (N(6)-L-threonylcarbamoyladenosine(37)-C(2))-methylthiotransferase MtaB [Eubacterium sp.]